MLEAKRRCCDVVLRSAVQRGVTWRRNSSDAARENKHLQNRRAAKNSLSAAYGSRQDARGMALGDFWRRLGRTQARLVRVALPVTGGAVKIAATSRGRRADTMTWTGWGS